GVAKVEVSGASPNEVQIAVEPDRLTAHDISLNELAQHLQALNFSVSAGEIEDGGRRLRVQPVGEITDLQQLRDLVIDRDGLRLGDIADVEFRQARLDMGRRLDGQPAVGLDIFKERNANLVEVSRTVLAEIEAISRESALSGVQMTVIQNLGKEVTSSLLELAEAGAIGLVLSILV